LDKLGVGGVGRENGTAQHKQNSENSSQHRRSPFG
jgi:hypothetical protein